MVSLECREAETPSLQQHSRLPSGRQSPSQPYSGKLGIETTMHSHPDQPARVREHAVRLPQGLVDGPNDTWKIPRAIMARDQAPQLGLASPAANGCRGFLVDLPRAYRTGPRPRPCRNTSGASAENPLPPRRSCRSPREPPGLTSSARPTERGQMVCALRGNRTLGWFSVSMKPSAVGCDNHRGR